MEFGPSAITGPGSGESEGIHPITLASEESAHRVRGTNRIPCFTSFGPILEIAEFADRAPVVRCRCRADKARGMSGPANSDVVWGCVTLSRQ